ncbi:MAG: DegQ family serine endoprotease [Vicinamibacterales bacterium]
MRPESTQHDLETPSRRGFGFKAGLSAGALILTGSLIGWSASTLGAGSPVPSLATSAPIAAPAGSGSRTIGASGDSYAPLVEQIAPAVVTVTSERRVRTTSSQMPDDPLLRQFFGDQFRGRRTQPQERREGGLGSGVIVRPDGYILTNNHVVEGADQVKVEMTDGRTFTAKVVGTDAPSDLAVLKIDGTNLHTVQLADSDKVRVGDVALAVGNPLGIGQTVTMGIVSAKGRATGASGGDGSYQDFIQTDAPINQGNSGGALVNTQGELIGINSQILSPSGGNIGIGFAIPANMAKNVMSQLIDHGNVRRGLLGVTIQPVTSDIARSLNVEARGALVNNLTAGGAAEQAGLRRGDIITAINGAAVRDTNSLRNEVGQMLPGSEVKVSILRDAKEQTVSVRLGEKPADTAEAEDGRGAGAASGSGFGLSVEPLTREIAQQLGVPMGTGLVITQVAPSSRAADAGLRQGDVIEEVDGVKVTTGEALRSALTKTSKNPALLLVHRGEATVYVPLDRTR